MTVGRVLAIHATIAVGYGTPGVALFRHLIINDCHVGWWRGSLLMDSGLNAIGLLFAGSTFVTIFNYIADLEFALGVRPVTT